MSSVQQHRLDCMMDGVFIAALCSWTWSKLVLFRGVEGLAISSDFRQFNHTFLVMGVGRLVLGGGGGGGVLAGCVPIFISWWTGLVWMRLSDHLVDGEPSKWTGGQDSGGRPHCVWAKVA